MYGLFFFLMLPGNMTKIALGAIFCSYSQACIKRTRKKQIDADPEVTCQKNKNGQNPCSAREVLKKHAYDMESLLSYCCKVISPTSVSFFSLTTTPVFSKFL